MNIINVRQSYVTLFYAWNKLEETEMFLVMYIQHHPTPTLHKRISTRVPTMEETR